MPATFGEAREFYEKALQMGKKEGGSPAVLDEILSDVGISANNGIPLGIETISLDQIVGTKTSGRKTSFSKSFYPLLSPSTEFGNKWISLCQSHLDEGIHDPVKVYEYLNRYYVLEGNKRVSVLRFFDSVDITAEVIRLMPPPLDRPDIMTYYEYVDFHHLSGINYVYFRNQGDFIKLQRLAGKRTNEYWSDEDRLNFRSVFNRFDVEYTRLAGKQDYREVSQAFLTFISIYDYNTLLSMNSGEWKSRMNQCKEEFALQLSRDPSKVQMNPYEKKVNPIRQLISTSIKNLKVAFIHDSTKEESGWTYDHDYGREHLERAFKDHITTTVYNHTDLEMIDRVLQEAVDTGHQVIFTTSPIFLKATLKAALEHENVRFLNCTTHLSYKHVRTYYARMYEVKFLMGVIAGSMTDNDKIGYIADSPIYGTIADINAFAFGARMVNPRAMIHLQWTSLIDPVEQRVRNMEEVYDYFRRNDIHILCDKDSFNSEEYTRRVGLYMEEKNGFWNMAMPVWDWCVFYEKAVTNILNGNWKSEENKGKEKGISYWWGISSGIVDIVKSGRLPLGTVRLVELLRDSMVRGDFHPFAGILYSQDKVVQSDIKGVLTPDQILSMDWLAHNVVGSIPPTEELTDEAKTLTRFVGADKGEHVL